MNVEVINTGTELLLGNTVNTHAAFFGHELFTIGLRVARQVTVPDGDPIRQVVQEALSRTEVILITGGIGPTTDDITREIIAEVLDLPLHFDQSVMDAMAERFERRGLVMRERNKRQAMVMRGATVLPNANGTAPGLYLPAHNNGRPTPHIFLLPGPPRELHPMFRNQVLPILRGILPDGIDLVCRLIRVAGLGESEVEARVGEQLLAIEGLELGYCARPGEVEVRLVGAAAVVGQAESIVLTLLSENVISDDGRLLEEVVVAALTERKRTCAVAESCTGGHITNRLTNVPGASQAVLAGFVTYANSAKTAALGVPAQMIEEHGAVSAPVAVAMAEGARRVSGADFAISTTGIAGPSGGSTEKPVGTLFVGFCGPDGVASAREFHFPTSRDSFKNLAAQAALDWLRREVIATSVLPPGASAV